MITVAFEEWLGHPAAVYPIFSIKLCVLCYLFYFIYNSFIVAKSSIFIIM